LTFSIHFKKQRRKFKPKIVLITTYAIVKNLKLAFLQNQADIKMVKNNEVLFSFDVQANLGQSLTVFLPFHRLLRFQVGVHPMIRGFVMVGGLQKIGDAYLMMDAFLKFVGLLMMYVCLKIGGLLMIGLFLRRDTRRRRWRLTYRRWVRRRRHLRRCCMNKHRPEKRKSNSLFGVFIERFS
jgi:hypothetical protein